MSNEWICRQCTEPCKAETPTRCAPDSCLFGWDKCKWEAVFPVPDTPPQPTLLTGYEAIAKAAREGGEVWHSVHNEFRISFDTDGNILKTGKREIDPTTKFYTVRPLPPADMDFDEALECLKRGEKVQVIGDGQIIVLVPEIGSTLAGYGIKFDFLKDKRFRKA